MVAAPKICLQLGDRWVKGLRFEGSRVQMFRCSSGETIHRIHTQARGLTVWVWRGSGGWRWKHLITFSPSWAHLSQQQSISLLLVHVSFFASFDSFSLSFSSSCLTRYPSLLLPLLLLHPLPEALSSELPRFFIKEISLKPSNYYGKRKNRGEKEGTQGNVLFLFLSHDTFLVAQMCTYNLHFSFWEDRDRLIFCSPCFLSALSSSASSLSLLGWVLMGLYGSPMLLRHLVLAKWAFRADSFSPVFI